MNPYLLIDIKQKYRPESPIGWDFVNSLMRKLSHRTRVICASEAAKMVLPIWEQYAFASTMSKVRKETPRKTIKNIEKWLDGKATKTIKNIENIKDVSGACWSRAANACFSAALVANTVMDYSSCYVASTTIYAATATASSSNPSNVVLPFNHLSDVTYAHDGYEHIYNTFYIEWWDRCYPLIMVAEYQSKYDTFCKEICTEFKRNK